MSFRKLLCLLAAFGSAGPVLAQRAAIAPLAPLATPVAVPLLPGIGLASQSPARPAAPAPHHPSRSAWPQPVYLVNSRIIVGSGLGKINPQNIASVYVYRGIDAPAKWRSLTANGILAITLKPHTKPKIKTKSLAAIKRELKLRGPVSYQLGGLPLEDLTLRVATADIAELAVQPTASGTVVTIRLAVAPPTVHPPGSIFIRGVAGL